MNDYKTFLDVCLCHPAYIQAVRGLLMIGLCLGLIGTVLTFFGMECTHIGADQRTNDKILLTSSAFHLVGCEYGFFALNVCESGLSCFSVCHLLSLMQAFQI